MLRLRMDGGITVDLTGRSQQKSCPSRLRQTQRVLRTATADRKRLQRMTEIIRRRGRACQMGDGVDRTRDEDLPRDVAFHEVKVRQMYQFFDVAYRPSGKVVDADHSIAPGEKGFTQVRSQEAGAAGDQYAHNAVPSGKGETGKGGKTSSLEALSCTMQFTFVLDAVHVPARRGSTWTKLYWGSAVLGMCRFTYRDSYFVGLVAAMAPRAFRRRNHRRTENEQSEWNYGQSRLQR